MLQNALIRYDGPASYIAHSVGRTSSIEVAASRRHWSPSVCT